jgi:hypothetical protein
MRLTADTSFQTTLASLDGFRIPSTVKHIVQNVRSWSRQSAWQRLRWCERRQRWYAKWRCPGWQAWYIECTTSFTHANITPAPKPPQYQLEQQFESMSLKGKLAVDGSPLVMDQPVSIPSPNPMPGNKVDPKAFQDIQKGLKASGLQAEFPLRQGLANPTTTVYTNHFTIKLDPEIPLYEYSITGLSSRVGNRTTRKLISEAMDNINCMKNNRDKFVIDYKLMRLVSWVDIDIPSMNGSARTSEWRDPVVVTFERLGKVNTDLLIQYSAGKLAPTAVCIALFNPDHDAKFSTGSRGGSETSQRGTEHGRLYIAFERLLLLESEQVLRHWRAQQSQSIVVHNTRVLLLDPSCYGTDRARM